MTNDLQGAVIADTDPDSAAGQAGLHRGAIVSELNKQPIHNAGTLAARSQSLTPNGKVLLRYGVMGRKATLALEQPR
jgi:S1-C subfamily serine protease